MELHAGFTSKAGVWVLRRGEKQGRRWKKKTKKKNLGTDGPVEHNIPMQTNGTSARAPFFPDLMDKI